MYFRKPYFHLQVATAPNAIVFGHSTMRTADMMKAGFVMNLICVVTLVISINTYAVPLFSLNQFPEWAAVKHPNRQHTQTSKLLT